MGGIFSFSLMPDEVGRAPFGRHRRRPTSHMLSAMHTHLTEALSRLDRSRAALRRALDAIPPGLHSQRPAPDRWSAAEVLEHLTLVEKIFGGRIAKALEAARGGLSPETQPRTPLPDAVEQRMTDRVNKRQAPEPAQPTGQLDVEAGWAALEQQHAWLRTLLAGCDGLALSRVTLDHP
ncbi:MAG TPA: DinB family protein, partial [Vicinamibacterales bacterium]|nr:DinB family protein [Vicinamibacterales bacterium]